jgi:hypothetical protein
MTLTLKKIATTSLMTIALMFGLTLIPALAAPASAATDASVKKICGGATAAGVDTCESADSKGLEQLVTLVLNVMSWVVGVISVIMIIIGGFRYIISSGDTNQVQSAKNTILYAVVGLIIVLFAQVIVRFVIGSVNEAA